MPTFTFDGSFNPLVSIQVEADSLAQALDRLERGDFRTVPVAGRPAFALSFEACRVFDDSGTEYDAEAVAMIWNGGG